MRIGELAEQAGTSTRTLRYYEQQGLLAARRTSNGYRDYNDVDLRLVQEIRTLLELGFNLEETRPFVDCLRSGRQTGAECPASIEVLDRKLSDLDSCIARLLLARRRVSNELAAARGRDDPATARGHEPAAVCGHDQPAAVRGPEEPAAHGRQMPEDPR
jgi:DNA-binding transcriptional MerR regulator